MKMIHPDVEAIADVVDEQGFNAVWAPRGWTLLSEPEAYASEVLGRPVKKVSDLKVEELKQLVSARGLEYPAASAKKDEVITTFRGTFGADATAPVTEGDNGTTDGAGTDAGDDTTDPAPAGTNQKGK